MAANESNCPVCGSANACALAQGEKDCWCFQSPAQPEVFDRLPKELLGQVCLCRTCLRGQET